MTRYGQSILERTAKDGSLILAKGDPSKAVSRGAALDAKSPCNNVSEDDYAFMVEHTAMQGYAVLPAAKPTLNKIASPGEKKIANVATLVKCPGLAAHAAADASKLLAMLGAKTPGSGK